MSSEDSSKLRQGFGSSAFGPPVGAVPTPTPTPAVVVPPPPVAGADFVCEHLDRLSYCHSKDIRIVFDRMEKFVRANNPTLARTFQTACGPSTVARPAVAGYPVQWLCGGNYLGLAPTSYYYRSARNEVPVRPNQGYNDMIHYNAPFRCWGAIGSSDVNTNQLFKSDLICYFDKGDVSGLALSDATATAFSISRAISNLSYAGYNAVSVSFKPACSIKTIMVGPTGAQNTPIPVLECKYGSPSPSIPYGE